MAEEKKAAPTPGKVIRCVANTQFYDAKGRLVAKGASYAWNTADGDLPKVLTEVPEAPKAAKAD